MMEEKFYNALALATRADYRKLKELKDKNASWETAWNSIPAGERRIVDPNNAFEALSQLHIKLLLLSDANFPEPLKEIHCPPLGIYVRGEIGRAQTPSLAIVGTRKSTEEGKETARAFARELASRGVRIVSGLALGIDAAAHEGALDAKGHTIAVLGNGLDQLYPRNNERIAKGIIASGGAIISEYPLGTPPLPHHFLERNRIVSGLTQGVLVIEAPKESGALATARFALEQNRYVFVVP